MLNQNKQQNKIPDITKKDIVFSISDLSVFKDKSRLFYLYKKTEKLTLALYLLSDFISDNEPLKWQLRQLGNDLLSVSTSLSVRAVSDSESFHRDFVSKTLNIVSCLNIAYLNKMISEMNFNILKYEFESLIQTVESAGLAGDIKGFIFPEQFFNVIPDTGNIPIGHNMSDRMSYIPKPQNSDSDKSEYSQSLKHNRHSHTEGSIDRQTLIIGLLKKDSELGIKDFVSSIKDCSEKTIQRELASLVSKGQVKKSGEKRWSRYSLNK